MRRHVSYALLALTIAGTAIACDDDDDPSGPQAEQFRATMNGPNEQPEPTTSTATGVANFSFLNDVLSWTVTLSGITNISAAHIHIGDAETAGGVILGLGTAGAGGTLTNAGFSGSVTRAAYTPGQGVSFDQLLERMRAGTVYVNVHTSNTALPGNNTPGDYPNGEIRGQINDIP
jgi:hypothetical protein